MEVFYPPTIGVLMLSAGLIPLALTTLDHLHGQFTLMDPLRAAGECSLVIYLVHYAIIVKMVEPLQGRLPFPAYMATFLVLFAGMILLAYLLRHVRASWRGQPFLVRFLIGS